MSVKGPEPFLSTDTRHTISAGEQAGSQWTAMSYDPLGRPSARAVKIDGSRDFEENYTYDQFGRPFQKFDASEDFAVVRDHYNVQGYLS